MLTQCLASPRVARQRCAAERHRIAGRVVPRDDDEDEAPDHLVDAEGVALVVGVYERRDEIAAGLYTPRLDLAGEDFGHLTDDDLQLVEPLWLRIKRGQRARHAIRSRPSGASRYVSGMPSSAKDHGAGQLAGYPFVELERRAARAARSRIVRDSLTDIRPQVLDDLAAECLHKELAQPCVLRAVHVRQDLRACSAVSWDTACGARPTA